MRAFVQHQPTTPWKAWYVTPAFRYERPQAGRYRQHHQLGVEVLGTDDPAVDVEVIALAHGFYEALGLTHVRLLINSMGHDACRAALPRAAERVPRGAPVRAVRRAPRAVAPESRCACSTARTRPASRSPPRAPMLIDHLCDDVPERTLTRCVAGLSAVGVASVLSPRLVRGFDYYTRTTFEFIADAAR